MDETAHPVEPERVIFNRTTCETQVWATRTDDPAWDPADQPVATYSATSISRELFDTLPVQAQLLIVNERQKTGVGWRRVDQCWEPFDIDHHETYTRASGRAPHATRTQPRRRGAGRPAVRGASRRSSARSGDSGSEDGEPEPPSRRLCAYCNKNIPADRSPRAVYCCDLHADRDRQRRKRQRDRERDGRPPMPQPADFWRMREFAGPIAAWSVGPGRPDWVYPATGRHSQSFRFPALGEYEALREAARTRVAREGQAA